MRYAVKNKKNIVTAYQLGAGSDMERNLIEEGAIRLTEDGRYELFSQEAKDGRGQLADKGDYFKVDVKDGKPYPYNNMKAWFEENHDHLEGDEYEQKSWPVMVWDAKDREAAEEKAAERKAVEEKAGDVLQRKKSDGERDYVRDFLPEEIRYLLDTGKLSIFPESEDRYFSAELWGTTLTQSKDGVVIIYGVDRDKDGRITDIDFGLVGKKEFDERYTLCEHHVLMLALSTFYKEKEIAEAQATVKKKEAIEAQEASDVQEAAMKKVTQYYKAQCCYYDRLAQNVLGTSDKSDLQPSFGNEGYYYQLEPVPLFIIGYLKEFITDVILLETEAVRTKDRRGRVEFIPADGAEPELVKENITASGYYKEWIRKKLGKLVNIIEIDVDEKNPTEALTRTMENVQTLHEDTRDKDNWRLWIDTHGGFRDISLSLVSAARFFATDKEHQNRPILTDGIYTVYYTQDNKSNEVINQKAYYFSDSVKAMKQFLDYGQYLAEKYRPYDGDGPFAFVSYRHDENNYVSIRNLFKNFSDEKIYFWYDDGIRYGDNWAEKLKEKNEESKIFVALLTDSYFESVECWKELLYAMKRKKATETGSSAKWRSAESDSIEAEGNRERLDSGAEAAKECCGGSDCESRWRKIHLVMLHDNLKIPKCSDDLKDTKTREKVKEIMDECDVSWDDVNDLFATEYQFLRWFAFMDAEGKKTVAAHGPSSQDLQKELKKIKDSLYD